MSQVCKCYLQFLVADCHAISHTASRVNDAARLLVGFKYLWWNWLRGQSSSVRALNTFMVQNATQTCSNSQGSGQGSVALACIITQQAQIRMLQISQTFSRKQFDTWCHFQSVQMYKMYHKAKRKECIWQPWRTVMGVMNPGHSSHRKSWHGRECKGYRMYFWQDLHGEDSTPDRIDWLGPMGLYGQE